PDAAAQVEPGRHCPPQWVRPLDHQPLDPRKPPGGPRRCGGTVSGADDHAARGRRAVGGGGVHPRGPAGLLPHATGAAGACAAPLPGTGHAVREGMTMNLRDEIARAVARAVERALDGERAMTPPPLGDWHPLVTDAVHDILTEVREALLSNEVQAPIRQELHNYPRT